MPRARPPRPGLAGSGISSVSCVSRTSPPMYSPVLNGCLRDCVRHRSTTSLWRRAGCDSGPMPVNASRRVDADFQPALPRSGAQDCRQDLARISSAILRLADHYSRRAGRTCGAAHVDHERSYELPCRMPPSSSRAMQLARADLTQQIRDAILGGEFAPHQRLIEADISERYDASRAAVRTALLNLANEGLVERLPNRGARVRAISIDEAVEIVEVRIGLETLCARKAAENLTDADAEELRRLRDDISAAVGRGQPDGVLAAEPGDGSPHPRAQPARHGHAAARAAARAIRAGTSSGSPSTPGRAAQSAPEHIAIIDALLARDPGCRRSGDPLAPRGHRRRAARHGLSLRITKPRPRPILGRGRVSCADGSQLIRTAPPSRSPCRCTSAPARPTRPACRRRSCR